MKLEQSLTDTCVFFKKDERGHLALMALTHVDDTLIAGNEEEIKNFKKRISRRFKFRDEGRLKKHLGVSYKWKQDEETGERLIEATMHILVDEIISKYQEIKGSEPKEYSTPGKPNEHLRKGTEQEECLHIKEYRSLVGNYMYLVTRERCKRFNKIFLKPDKGSLESPRKSNRIFEEDKGHNKHHFQETKGAKDDTKCG